MLHVKLDLKEMLPRLMLSVSHLVCASDYADLIIFAYRNRADL